MGEDTVFYFTCYYCLIIFTLVLGLQSCMSLPQSKSEFQDAIDQQSRVLPIDGVINFRDLGGYQTQDGEMLKYGFVYRSAQLSGLTPEGIEQMASLGVKSVMDLRFEDEIIRFPSVKKAFPNAEFVCWHDLQPTLEKNQNPAKPSVGKGSWRDSLDSHDPDQVREAMRINYPQKLYSHRYIYKDMLMRLISHEAPLLFHCAAGKDRTGVAAALILGLMDVGDDIIIEDYLVTAETTKGLLESFHAAGAATNEGEQDFHSKLASYPQHVLKPIFDADSSYIITLLDYMNSEYGGFSGYAVKVLGFRDEHIKQLKQVLVA